MIKTDFVTLANINVADAPFPHFSSNQIFKQGIDQQLINWFEESEVWEFTKTSFYTQYEFSLLHIDLPEFLHELVSGETISLISKKMEVTFNSRKLNLVGVTAHKLLEGHRMGVHNDYIGQEETHRLVVQLNKNWKPENGGYLMLFNSKDPQDVAMIVQPFNNTAIGFEISPKSYHAVSKVYSFVRYTIVYTFNEQKA